LKLSATIDPWPDLSTHYDEIRGASFFIISGLATLIMHLGGEEIPVQELEILTHQAKDDALELHTASMPPKPPPQVSQDPIPPPVQINSSLKMKIFHQVIASHHHPARPIKPAQILMTRKITPVSTVELSMGLEMEHI
jgi:hypothetical protein